MNDPEIVNIGQAGGPLRRVTAAWLAGVVVASIAAIVVIFTVPVGDDDGSDDVATGTTPPTSPAGPLG